MTEHHEAYAEQFLKDTRHVDMSALRDRFLVELPQAAKLHTTATRQ
ncbi:hypothetical protein [Antarctobacter sp.]